MRSTVESATIPKSWRRMESAPKDGTKILVATRATEQGPAEVDIVQWTVPVRAAEDCWVSTDSTGDCAIVYEDWEVAFWMPLPGSMAPVRTPDLAARLPQVPRADEEIGGSGI